MDDGMTNERIRDVLELIQRSPDRGNGWRSVSKTCWPLVEDMPSELVELDSAEHRIRMTERGQAVLQFSVGKLYR
jgi:hypothetical protein